MNSGFNTLKAATLVGAATGAQAAVSFQPGRQSGLLQLLLSGTGTVRVQGRLDPLAPSNDLTGDVSASGITAVANVTPEMRINVTANSANLDAWLMA